MGTRQKLGCAVGGTAYMILSILGLVIHVVTIIIAFMTKGLLSAVISAALPGLAQVYWFFKIGINMGFTNNLYCISIIAYVGLWIIVFIGMAIAENRD